MDGMFAKELGEPFPGVEEESWPERGCDELKGAACQAEEDAMNSATDSQSVDSFDSSSQDGHVAWESDRPTTSNGLDIGSHIGHHLLHEVKLLSAMATAVPFRPRCPLSMGGTDGAPWVRTVPRW
ncbi:hypothetical protein AK812_SmicGene28480 [Symbiodinium microadriaticum]|uniref:Uncharacterized protein n=1 Tax=Symbiodinium microadriaticum TaxID=2951 RepID=A0A1Q9D469_SYMMI|nr:hypothetical protein AK812_SmicGene28480 [Symbiodinium microadriaticum]